MLISPNALNTVARVATEGMLNSLLAGIAIVLVAWTVTRLFGRHGSGTRFAVWFSALVTIAVLPWLGYWGTGHGQSVTNLSKGAVTLPASFASYLFAAWMVGAAFGLLRVGFGLYRLRKLRSTCTAVNLTESGAELSASLAEIQTHRRVTLCTSNAVRVPAAIGYVHPMVVFPEWMFQEFPPEELNAILLHELAHLRRWDDWTNLAQKIVKAVFFFHPAVWFIDSRLSLEREMACDDAVLAADFSPRAYAASLIGLAEKSFLHRGVQLAQAAVSHVQQLKSRVVEIMRKDREGTGLVWKPAVALVAVAGIVSAYSASSGPQLFAFSPDSSQLAATTFPNAGAGLLRTDALLRPVSLRLVETASQTRAVTHAVPAVRLRTTRRVPLKPQFALAQRGTRRPFLDEEIAAPPMVVRSNFATAQGNAVPLAVLIVMQGEQFGADGPVFWHLTIVHLTQAEQRAITRGFPKQI